jgi:hypothetical protein
MPTLRCGVCTQVSKADLKLDWCTHKAAKYACQHYHYSKTIPANKSNRIGVWEDGKFIGCVIFGLGASPSLGKPYGLGIFEICELTRVALTKHASPVSRILAIATKMVKAKNTKTRLAISFADTFHGHHGGIYQAAGWIYTGQSSPSTMLRLPGGEMADPRRFNGHGHNAKKAIPDGTIEIKTPGKHRYLMPLDDEMRKQIEPLRKPYPKRAGSADSGTPGLQPGRGGANPTPALISAET